MKEYTENQTQQAAEWFLIIHDAQDPSAETLLEWNRWLNASVSNRAAFEAVEQAYHLAVPSLAVPLSPAPAADHRRSSQGNVDEYDGDISVAEWLARNSAQASQVKRSAGVLQRRWPSQFKSLALAATVAIATLVTSLWVYKQGGLMPTSSNGTFITRTAEHMDLRLADGSRVTLGARSKFHVEFDGATRSVRLESGEAFFDVHKDPTRPFVVRALDGVITAIGTAFNVRATDNRVTVAVTEGVVSIADGVGVKEGAAQVLRSSGNGNDMRLSLGEQVSFISDASSSAPQAKAIIHVAADEAARWREGWLIYRNEPLRYVIADVARYTDLKIDIVDGVGEDLRFSGAVFKDNVDEWITALPKVFPLAIDSSSTRITIDKK